MRYHDLLGQIHERLEPKVYLEIGVKRGRSLARAGASTHAIAIDPRRQPLENVSCSFDFYEMASDDFFAEHSPRYDLALIDGKHLFEFALRDFMNLERLAADSVILFHDCIPVSADATRREAVTKFWTGDVWKLVPILQEWRPDLSLMVVDVPPSGLGIVTGLDPRSRALPDAYDEIEKRFLPLEYEDSAVYDFETVTPAAALERL